MKTKQSDAKIEEKKKRLNVADLFVTTKEEAHRDEERILKRRYLLVRHDEHHPFHDEGARCDEAKKKLNK